MVFNCCVPGCKNYNSDAQMHIFPKNQALYDLWIAKVGRADLKEKPKERVRKSYRVCNIHFGPEALYVGMRNKSYIKYDAVPSLFLSNSSDEAPSHLDVKVEAMEGEEEEDEKLLLASLVDKYIVGKRNDATTVQHKVWEKIAVEFNTQANLVSGPRTPIQLKELWNNLKISSCRKRKATTQLKYEHFLSGCSDPSEDTDPLMEAEDLESVSSEQAEESGLPEEVIVTEKAGLFLPSISDMALPTPNTSLGVAKTKGTTTLEQKEEDLRSEKFRQSIVQQKELHDLQILLAKEQLRAATALRKKAEAEAELAILQLKIFKDEKGIHE